MPRWGDLKPLPDHVVAPLLRAFILGTSGGVACAKCGVTSCPPCGSWC